MSDQTAGGEAGRPPLSAHLRRDVLVLMGGLLLWTAGHFGVLAVLPLFLHDQGYDARSIGFTLGATGLAQLCVRPFAGWIVDALGRRKPLALALVLLSGAAALLLVPAGWAVHRTTAAVVAKRGKSSVSATVFAEIKKTRRATASQAWASASLNPNTSPRRGCGWLRLP